MSYTNLLYHIIFRTKYSIKSIPTENAEELYRYIWGIIRNKGCTLYRIGGMPDHIHILVAIKPSLSVSELVKTIKVQSNHFIHQNPDKFPYFSGWGDEYCAITYNYRDKDMIIKYIRNQSEHHKAFDFKSELQRIFEENCMDFDERFVKDK